MFQKLTNEKLILYRKEKVKMKINALTFDVLLNELFHCQIVFLCVENINCCL